MGTWPRHQARSLWTLPCPVVSKQHRQWPAFLCSAPSCAMALRSGTFAVPSRLDELLAAGGAPRGELWLCEEDRELFLCHMRTQQAGSCAPRGESSLRTDPTLWPPNHGVPVCSGNRRLWCFSVASVTLCHQNFIMGTEISSFWLCFPLVQQYEDCPWLRGCRRLAGFGSRAPAVC